LKRYSFSIQEKIKNKKDFEKIFSTGKVIFSSDRKIKATYIIKKNHDHPGVKVAAVVYKKAGIAVWRNRTKRLIKEAYRLNKEKLMEECIMKKVMLLIAFSPYYLNEKNNKKLRFNDVMQGVVEIMLKLKSSI